MIHCLLTNDVETTSIVNNFLSDSTGLKVLTEGMPLLLDLYAKYDIKSTFFFTGHIAKLYPEIVKMILPYGHEVASHGLTHDPQRAFDILTYNDQLDHLLESKKILEDISGQEVISFRAPALRVNSHTPLALTEAGFKVDSSVASQRFDMFMSFGSIKKLKWMTAPRMPYFTDQNDLLKKGNGTILEIPISALLMPYIGTTLRIFPFVSRQVRKSLVFESGLTGKPIVFLIHPNEFITEVHDGNKTARRSSNFFSYFLADVVRRELKLKNLGKAALPLYNKEIDYFTKRKYEFVTCKQYYYNYLKNRESNLR